MFLVPSGEVGGWITSFSLFWLLVPVWLLGLVLCDVEGIVVVVVIPIDWNAINALYVFFVVFLFLGLVV